MGSLVNLECAGQLPLSGRQVRGVVRLSACLCVVCIATGPVTVKSGLTLIQCGREKMLIYKYLHVPNLVEQPSVYVS